MQRWLPSFISILIGIALGLVYGWVINPVEFVDTTPDTLRADYRVDYVLMVAEAYQADGDPSVAARRLAVLSSQAPGEVASGAADLARQYGFSNSDIELIQKLTTAMQAWQPNPGGGVP
jgi:hypothetical protein